MTDISIIIPSNHDHHELLKIVRALCQQKVKPAEIVIVDSSLECGACPGEVTKSCAFSGIRLIYVHLAHALPGQARNIGLELAKAELIAFIDVLLVVLIRERVSEPKLATQTEPAPEVIPCGAVPTGTVAMRRFVGSAGLGGGPSV